MNLTRIAELLIDRKIAFFIENPLNSYFWNLAAVQRLSGNVHTDYVTFQHCMFDGKRNKWTKLLFYPKGLFLKLHRVCDHSHTHEPWGRTSEGTFATATEAVYPQALCDAILGCLAVHLHLQRGPPIPVLRARGEAPPQRPRDDRASVGV